jgi:CRISPR-associated Csx2 family protein
MRKVFLSFLGLGQFDKVTKKYQYRETVYELAGQLSSPTRFVQIAEQQLLGRDFFDIFFIAATDKSAKAHFEFVRDQLASCRGEVCLLSLDENMSEAGQWGWFEKIFNVMEDGDELCVDLTHGYRSVPVIFSAAINFLQKTKNITLTHVFYGAFEEDKQHAPLVDMKSFFDINIWTDAVARLVNDADAGGIANAADKTNKYQFSELANPVFVKGCSAVTRRIKSVDVNNVADDVVTLLQQIEMMKEDCSTGTAILLDLVRDKFVPLVSPQTGNPDRNRYTLDYFKIQLSLARLLIEHGLFMQAFTVMREWLSSLVMLHFESLGAMKAKKRRTRVQRYGAVFFAMLQYGRNDWNFPGREDQVEKILPFYNLLKKEEILTSGEKAHLPVAKILSRFRNGFDHAWLGKAGMDSEVEQQAGECLQTLEEILQRLAGAGIGVNID